MSFEELTATTLEGEGPRHAALLVHAMTMSDRKWILEKLSAQEQEYLQPLLTELESLGIQGDRHLLTELLSSVTNDFSPPMAYGEVHASSHPSGSVEPGLRGLSDEAFFAQFGSIDTNALAAILGSEPPLLTAYLLQLRDWPWHQELLEKLSLGNRKEVQNQLQKPKNIVVGAALSEALLRHIRMRCEKTVDGGGSGRLNEAIFNPATSKDHKHSLQKLWSKLRGTFE